jgi:uncharacterized membrane protein YqjE
MAAPEGTGPGVTPSLYASIRSFWGALVAILYTRLDLVTAELEDQAIHGIKLLLAGLIAVLSLFMAFFFAMYLLIAIYWDTPYRPWVIGGVLAVYLLVGVILLFVARGMIVNRPKLLAQTISELRRDAEALSRVVAVKKDEVQS